jgi:dTDP-4-dehydrorhamnose reductase
MLTGGRDALLECCKRSGGVVHMAASGEASWHGFACAIVEGLKARGLKLAIEQVVPISTDQYPTKAQRPRNSRLNLTRLQSVFDITPPSWQDALSPELNHLAREFGSAQSGG